MNEANSLAASWSSELLNAGLSRAKLTGVQYDRVSGYGEAVFRTGLILLKISRERGQDFLEVGSANKPGEFFRFDDVCVAFGWRSIEEIMVRQEPIPLHAELSELRQRLPSLENAFSEAYFRETRDKIEAAADKRESAFLEKLRRLAELHASASKGRTS